MDVEDLTPLMKQLVDLIRPKAEDVPDAVRHTQQLRQRGRTTSCRREQTF